jgi:hypothetical protein
VTSDRLSDKHIEYLLRRPETSFNAVEMALAREVQESRAEIERLRAAVEWWQDLAGAVTGADNAWERYGLSCHRSYLRERALADRLAVALRREVLSFGHELHQVPADALAAYDEARRED